MTDESEFLRQHLERVARFPQDVREAHEHTANHREEILTSRICGCFYCCRTFAPSAIEEWTDFADDDEQVGTTAMCPLCGIDSVIGDESGFEPTPEFLAKLHRYWF
jgi:hypothetical protein